MSSLTVLITPCSLVLRSSNLKTRPPNPFFTSHIRAKALINPQRTPLLLRSAVGPAGSSAPTSLDDADDGPEIELEVAPETELESSIEDGFEVEVEKVGGKKNHRRIRARISVDAGLEAVWSVLTDYEGLADFIPSVAVSKLLDKKEGFARLYQVGRQNLGLGLKFDAKAVLDCYEGDLEIVPSGRRRDIEFKMVEGDFKLFDGRWSIEQINNDKKNSGSMLGQEFQTTLSYHVELEPKRWLPVVLLQGRICREVKLNLQCVRKEAQRVQKVGSEVFSTWEIEKNNDNPTG